MIQLPEAFREKMKRLLKEEYDSFIDSYEMERVQGLRRNPIKITQEEFERLSPFHLKKIPWVKEGYYYSGQERPGKHPYHEAGLYYIQEPSAMAVVELLDPRPGETILDLCAAPGGKTTHIAGRLKGEGFLVSNEIHPARAKILSQNVERLGVKNGVVTNEDSHSLSQYFPEFFDRIVVDAPCSGEGMFRKDEAARLQWSPDHVNLCAKRQGEILLNAAAMLKPGGVLVYSTCTFSPEENEQVIEEFLLSNDDFSIEDKGERQGLSEGRPEWSKTGRKDLKKTFRIWPHKTEGEGHYLAVLKKADRDSGKIKRTEPEYCKDALIIKEAEKFFQDILVDPASYLIRKEYILFGDQLYLISPEMIQFKGMKVLRPGLHIGTIKKNRLEPSHALALALKKEEIRQWVDLPAAGGEIIRYLKGETLSEDGLSGAQLEKKGWVLMNVDGYSIGFAKLAGGILKNHYPKGLRWM